MIVLETIGKGREQYIVCPVCGRRTEQKITPETTAENLPLWCRRCKHETMIVRVRGLIVRADL